jgi:RNA polymerase sigma-70 factor (ECF subfamily)
MSNSDRDAVPLMDQLFSGASRLVRDRDDAEDLVQETMLRAYIGFRSFRAGTNLTEVEVLEALPDVEIQAALLSLREEFRMAIYYADVEGFSYAQIADIMGTRIGTVTSRLHRARTQLRKSLSTLAAQRRVLHPTP